MRGASPVSGPGNLQGVAFCLGSIGFIVLGRDDFARAAEVFEEALRALKILRDRVGVFHCLLGAGSVAAWRGEPDRAARLWGAAESLGETAAVPSGALDPLPLRLRGPPREGTLPAGRGGVGRRHGSRGGTCPPSGPSNTPSNPHQRPPKILMPGDLLPRVPERPRGRGARAGRQRPHQRPDSPRTLHKPPHRKRPRGIHLPQDRLLHPRPGRPLRLRARPTLSGGIGLRVSGFRKRSDLVAFAHRGPLFPQTGVVPPSVE